MGGGGYLCSMSSIRDTAMIIDKFWRIETKRVLVTKKYIFRKVPIIKISCLYKNIHTCNLLLFITTLGVDYSNSSIFECGVLWLE